MPSFGEYADGLFYESNAIQCQLMLDTIRLVVSQLRSEHQVFDGTAREAQIVKYVEILLAKHTIQASIAPLSRGIKPKCTSMDTKSEKKCERPITEGSELFCKHHNDMENAKYGKPGHVRGKMTLKNPARPDSNIIPWKNECGIDTVSLIVFVENDNHGVVAIGYAKSPDDEIPTVLDRDATAYCRKMGWVTIDEAY